MLSRLGRAALAYGLRLSWPVLPVAGKVPLTARGVLDATVDPATITGWWQRWPAANVGLAAGPAAGWWCLDVDGEAGEDSLAALERQHGALPATVEALTGGGGRHLLWRHVDGLGNRVRVAPGLDVRTAGGYIVAAPSVHPTTGRPYAWSVDGHPLEVAIAEAPGWLVDLVRGSAPAATAEAGGEAGPVFALPETVNEGSRNGTVARLVGYMLRKFVDPEVCLTLAHSYNEARCRPPLPRAEVVAAVNSLLRRELQRREAIGNG